VTAPGTKAELPGTYADPWEALDGLAGSVPEAERPVWLAVIAGLRAICSELESSWDQIALDHLQVLLDGARRAVNGVLQFYGAPTVPPDKHVLVADLRAPFEFTLGRDLKQAIASSLREYWRFDRFGLGEILAKAERERTFRLCSPAGPEPMCACLPGPERSIGLASTWEDMIAAACGRHEEDARAGLGRWYAELEPVWRERGCRIDSDCSLEGAPLSPGSALVRIQSAGSNLALRIGALTPDPCLFYSRFHRLFREADSEDTFSRWYRHELRNTEARHGTLLFADLAARATADANAAARPRFCDVLADTAQGEFPSAGSAVVVDEDGRGHWILPDGRELVPMLHSAVSLEDSDPWHRSAHQIARLLGRPSLMRPIPIFERELAGWMHLPRISIGAGAVISPERWIAPPALPADLAGETGLDPFIAWRRFVRSAGLPATVYWKHSSHETEILMHADSVLAVENLGRTLAAYPGTFCLQEAFPSAATSWVRDECGRHYTAELAVAWGGDDEFWSEYASAARLAVPFAAEGAL
jgi:hypothetical protein